MFSALLSKIDRRRRNIAIEIAIKADTKKPGQKAGL
jgi:hypothetical protein